MMISQEILFLFLGVLGIFVIAFDLHGRRKILEQELVFTKKKFEEEKEIRKKRLELLETETLRLAEVSELMADKIAAQLKDNVNWAVEALEQAKLKPRAQTLFSDRLRHFHEEKEEIARQFVRLLLNRCKAFTKSGKNVYIIIDSGTTLYQLFEILGRESVRLYEDNDEWVEKLTIVTNNLPGVETLMETGRIDTHNRFSPLAIKCKLLPGAPLPVYSAVTGDETNEALKSLRLEANNDTVFIGLVTGNWIRLRRSVPYCPVPLVRGRDHLEFKQTLIDISDEIYVLTPLGKIFIGVSPEEVNQALDFSELHTDPDKKPYSEVKITDEKAKSVKLVSTSRENKHVLSILSTKVSTLLNVNETFKENFHNASCENLPHVLFPFDNLPDNWHLEIETEFPHPNTRDRKFMEKFFYVPYIQER